MRFDTSDDDDDDKVDDDNDDCSNMCLESSGVS